MVRALYFISGDIVKKGDQIVRPCVRNRFIVWNMFVQTHLMVVYCLDNEMI